MTTGAPVQLWVVKQVMSGDSFVLRGQPRGGPPPEKQFSLNNIVTPRMARRPADGAAHELKDEPFAWEARELVRQLCVGKQVAVVVDHKAPSGREYGYIYVGCDTEGVNVAEALVAEGLAEVRQGGNRTAADEQLTRLNDQQNAAKASGKGKWGADETLTEHVRDIKWVVDSPRHLVDSLHQVPQKAVIEHVRDGSTVRAFLLPDFYYVTVMMSGIKCPVIKYGEGGAVVESEPFSEEARYFTESRLLQRDVEIVLESVSNQNFVGSVMHPNGNIAEVLLREGFAKCVSWSIAICTSGPEVMRAAERSAMEKRLRMWKSYEPSAAALNGTTSKSFQAEVAEIVGGDCLMVRQEGGELLKVFLSSVRAPQGAQQAGAGRQFRPLYDIPFMFDAREFLRKRLIGKTVSVSIDYVQPKQEDSNGIARPERKCCTVLIGQQNVAEALVTKGLATVVRYRQDDDNRSSQYDLLLAAEAKAEKTRKGVHSLKGGGSGEKVPVLRIQDMQGDLSRSKQFLPYLQRAGRTAGVVEFVASGSRVRLYVPKETCLITFLLSGISCPRAPRYGMRGNESNPSALEGEPFGQEALQFTKDRCLQREVEIEVESMDRAGNFVGWLWTENGNKNLSELLVEAGLASVHFSAQNSTYYASLQRAEERAKEQRLNVLLSGCVDVASGDVQLFANAADEQAAEEAERAAQETAERDVKYRPIVVTEVNANLHVAVQFCDEGPKLEKMMEELRKELDENPPVRGAFVPRKGELCAAKFVDNQWYRAKVESMAARDKAQIRYIDFGNREVAEVTSLAPLPALFHAVPPGAHEFALALVCTPEDAEMQELCAAALKRSLSTVDAEQQLSLNREYRAAGVEHCTIVIGATAAAATAAAAAAGASSDAAADTPPTDVGRLLVEQGFALADQRRERRLQALVADYMVAQAAAKRGRLNMWEYGDFTGDEI